MSKKKSKPKKAKPKKTKRYSTLEQHKRKGPALLPPLATLPNLAHSSWINDRLPELLWCALLVTHLGQTRALAIFRRGIIDSRPLLAKTTGRLDLGLSGLMNLPEPARNVLIDAATNDPDARSVLRPLLLFPDLPGREFWSARLDPPQKTDWQLVAAAVGHTFDHQSQEATDCRWARVVFMAVNGRMILPTGAEELAKELLEYPNYGDQRKVRPTVRALEMSFSSGPDVPAEPWAAAFWDHCWRTTPCRPSSIVASDSTPSTATAQERINQVSSMLQNHFNSTIPGTALNPKHDAVFGLAAYALSLTGELLRTGNAVSLMGRAVLRIILEIYVTLSYLLDKNSSELWATFRAYGSGQAKLAFLKLDTDEGIHAGYVNIELLDLIANEDRSLEFLPIVVGHWGETNLRQMAEEARVKAVYDQFYPWPSAFVHGNWAALRASMFDVCVNPLHRAHRLLRDAPTSQSDVVGDAVGLVDRVLDLVDRSYPGLDARLHTGHT